MKYQFYWMVLLIIGLVSTVAADGMVLAKDAQTPEITVTALPVENQEVKPLSGAAVVDIHPMTAGVMPSKALRVVTPVSGKGVSIVRTEGVPVSTRVSAVGTKSRRQKKTLKVAQPGSVVNTLTSKELQALHKRSDERKSALIKALDANPARSKRLLKNNHVANHNTLGGSSESGEAQK